MNKLILLLLTAITWLSAWAGSPQAGKIYRVKNLYYSKYLTGNALGGAVTCTDRNAESATQLWQVQTAPDGNGLTFQCLNNGGYMRNPNSTSVAWTLSGANTEANTHLVVTASNSNSFSVKAVNTASALYFMHCDNSHKVVCWTAANNNPSFWDFEEATDIPADKLAEIMANLNIQNNLATYQAHLDALFSDKACTQLKVTNNLENNAHYKALPETLKAMVLKVKSGNWAETYSNGVEWNDAYARKYRVQSYEPYSDADRAGNLARIQPYTNMNNPTGIVGELGKQIFVMVDGDLDPEAHLHIQGTAGIGMLNDPYLGTELHSGLNVVNCNEENAAFYVFYTYQTADGRTLKTKITDKSPIKIHIEGGKLNGFFNTVGDAMYTPDTRADFDYTSARARHTMYDLIGRYVVLHFYLHDAPSTEGGTELVHHGIISSLNPAINTGSNKEYDPVKIIKAWDEMCLAERTLMGLQGDADLADPYLQGMYESVIGDNVCNLNFDYSDYFNNKMLGINIHGIYMNATSYRTAYDPSTTSAVLTTLPYGNIWGPAHEYGHVNQHPIKIAGTTEISNNVFSNVVLYYSPYGTTSRADMPSVQQRHFMNGDTYLDYGLWSCTRMYWQLWVYYHAAGNNKKFYPRWFELMRNNPLQKSYNLNPRYDALQLYKMACVAAQEDLTDFFESWGFFVPLENYHIGDYSNYYATLTQEDIDAVKAEVKAYGFPKNIAIIFADDRPGSTRNTHSDFLKNQAGLYGGIADLKAKVTPSANVRAELSDGKIVFSVPEGEKPGVGFILRDLNGKMLAFSNSNEMPLNDNVLAMVMAGETQLVQVGANNSQLVTPMPLTTAQILGQLNPLMATVREIITNADASGTIVGCYRPKYLSSLTMVYSETQTLINDPETTNELLRRAYLTLRDELLTLKATPFALIEPIAGANYRIISRQTYNNKQWYLAPNTDNRLALKAQDMVNAANDNTLWKFERQNDGQYYIRNASTGTYIYNNESNRTPMLATEQGTSGGNHLFGLLTSAQTPYHAIALQSNAGSSLNITGNNSNGLIIYWGSGDLNSQWRIIMTGDNAAASNRFRLQEILAEAKVMLNANGTVTNVYEPIALTGANYTSNHPYQTQNYATLCDNNPATYYHSDWSNSNGSDFHNITIDLGAGQSVQNFQITWTNRQPNAGAQVEYIRAYNLLTSNNGTDFTLANQVSAGLPTGSAETYAGNNISLDAPARYIRLEVTQSQTSRTVPFFALSELGINRHSYDASSPEILTLALAINNGSKVLANASATAQALNDAIVALEQAMDAFGGHSQPSIFEQLKALTQQAEALLNQAGTVVSRLNDQRLDIANDKFFSNAKCQDTRWGDQFTSFSVINDSNPNTYFHSDYSAQAPNDYHHIGAELPEPQELVALYYRNRHTGSSGKVEYITAYDFEGSVDGINYELLSRVTSGLPNTYDAEYTSPMLTLEKPYNYLRMVVKGAESQANNHPYFVLTEFGFIPGQWVATPNTEEYPNLTAAPMLDVHKALTNAQKELSFGLFNTELNLTNAHTALLQKYNALQDAMTEATGIEQLTPAAPQANSTITYDLQGRQVLNPTHGLYIRGGRLIRL